MPNEQQYQSLIQEFQRLIYERVKNSCERGGIEFRKEMVAFVFDFDLTLTKRTHLFKKQNMIDDANMKGDKREEGVLGLGIMGDKIQADGKGVRLIEDSHYKTKIDQSFSNKNLSDLELLRQIPNALYNTYIISRSHKEPIEYIVENKYQIQNLRGKIYGRNQLLDPAAKDGKDYAKKSRILSAGQVMVLVDDNYINDDKLQDSELAKEGVVLEKDSAGNLLVDGNPINENRPFFKLNEQGAYVFVDPALVEFSRMIHEGNAGLNFEKMERFVGMLRGMNRGLVMQRQRTDTLWKKPGTKDDLMIDLSPNQYMNVGQVAAGINFDLEPEYMNVGQALSKEGGFGLGKDKKKVDDDPDNGNYYGPIGNRLDTKQKPAANDAQEPNKTNRDEDTEKGPPLPRKLNQQQKNENATGKQDARRQVGAGFRLKLPNQGDPAESSTDKTPPDLPDRDGIQIIKTKSEISEKFKALQGQQEQNPKALYKNRQQAQEIIQLARDVSSKIKNQDEQQKFNQFANNYEALLELTKPDVSLSRGLSKLVRTYRGNKNATIKGVNDSFDALGIGEMQERTRSNKAWEEQQSPSQTTSNNQTFQLNANNRQGHSTDA